MIQMLEADIDPLVYKLMTSKMVASKNIRMTEYKSNHFRRAKVQANKIIEDIQSDLGAMPLNLESQSEIINTAVARNLNEYSASWMYISQAINGHYLELNRWGYYYHTGNGLIPFGLFIRQHDMRLCCHIISQLSDLSAQKLLSEYIAIKFNIPVYIRKLDYKSYIELLEDSKYIDANLEPWHLAAPLEDDTFPEIIVDIKKALDTIAGSRYTDAQNKYRRFVKKNRTRSIEWLDINKDNSFYAISLVHEFFSSHKDRLKQISIPSDYYNIIDSNKYNNPTIRKLLLIDSVPSAFLALERIGGSDTVGLYCNIALHDTYPYISEFILEQCFRDARQIGATYINLGGSETKGLDQFKKKCCFGYKENPRYWAICQV